MRLPNTVSVNKSTVAKSNTSAPASQNAKRSVVAGSNCEIPVLKTTPFEFDTVDGGYGLAFGSQTFYFKANETVRIDPSNLPLMTAVRPQLEYFYANPVAGQAPAACVPQNYTFADNQTHPSFVMAPGQVLNNYTAPSDTRQGPLVWKMTPFFVETIDGGFVANGTQNVYARGSNLSLSQFPMQLALRPSIEFVPADASPGRNAAGPVTTAAPTNVLVILPVQPSSDARMMSYLKPTPVATGWTSITSLVASSTVVAPSATSSLMPTFAPSPTGVPGKTKDSADHYIAGSVLSAAFVALLLGIAGKHVYNKYANRTGATKTAAPASDTSSDVASTMSQLSKVQDAV